MAQDLVCVYRTATIEQAGLAVAWLAEHGIQALVSDAHSVSVVYSPLVPAPRGVEVCVLDPTIAERARALLQAQFEKSPVTADTERVVETRCEECGDAVVFPGSQGGTVQDCPSCGRFVDVPLE